MDLFEILKDIFGAIWLTLSLVVPKLLIVLFVSLVFQGILMIYFTWVTKIPKDENGFMVIDPKSWHFRFIYGKELKKNQEYDNAKYNWRKEQGLEGFVKHFLRSLTIKMCPYALQIWTKALFLFIWAPIATAARWILCVAISILSICLWGSKLKNKYWRPLATAIEMTGRSIDSYSSPTMDEYFENLDFFYYKNRTHIRPILAALALLPLWGGYLYIKALINGIPWVMYASVIIGMILLLAGIIVLTIIIRGKIREKTIARENKEALQASGSLLAISKDSLLNRVCPIARVKMPE